MRIVGLSASLGVTHKRNVSYDGPPVHVPQTMPEDWTYAVHHFTDETMPLRTSMSPYLQARIPKCYGWSLVPGGDVYVWLDACFRLARPDALAWLIEQLGDAHIALYAHPFRSSIHAEAAFIQQQLPQSRRLMKRYTGDRIAEWLELLDEDGYQDNVLFAGGVLAYRPRAHVMRALGEWGVTNWLYTTNDQLTLPYHLTRNAVRVSVLPGDIYHSEHLQFTREQRRSDG